MAYQSIHQNLSQIAQLCNQLSQDEQSHAVKLSQMQQAEHTAAQQLQQCIQLCNQVSQEMQQLVTQNQNQNQQIANQQEQYSGYQMGGQFSSPGQSYSTQSGSMSHPTFNTNNDINR